MNLKDYLNCSDKEELTEHLKKLDLSIMALHQNGFYIVSFDPNNIMLYNGELTLASFKDKIDYLNSGLNNNGDKKDILMMCAIGICAYNGFSNFYINNEFIIYLMNNLELFRENGQIPDEIYEYYCDVLLNGNIDYLNNFLNRKADLEASCNSNSNTYRLSKSTAIGRAFSDRENAYVNVLIFPAIFALIYSIFVVLMMVLK